MPVNFFSFSRIKQNSRFQSLITTDFGRSGPKHFITSTDRIIGARATESLSESIHLIIAFVFYAKIWKLLDLENSSSWLILRCQHCKVQASLYHHNFACDCRTILIALTGIRLTSCAFEFLLLNLARCLSFQSRTARSIHFTTVVSLIASSF